MIANVHEPGARYQALIELLQTAEGIWNGSRLFFTRWDLSPSQFNILNLLRLSPEGMSQVELSRALIMHRSNVTGLVDRLEARGLVRREEQPGDRRAYRVVVTPGGQQLVHEILPHYYKAAEEVWGDLPERRVTQLLEDLAAVRLNAERIATEMKGSHET